MNLRTGALRFVALYVLMAACSFASAQVNLSTGLVAHLPLDGNGEDFSTNQNDATIQGSQVFPGINRLQDMPRAMRFIGQDGQAMMTFGEPLLNNLSEFTLSYWFSLASGLNGMNLIGQDNVLETAYYLTSGVHQLRIFHPVSGVINIPLTSPIFSNWRHVLISGNASELNIYLNGALVYNQAGNFTLASNSFPTNLGGEVVSQTSTNWMRGSLDELRIYSRVLNGDEIAALSDANFLELSITSVSNTSFCAGTEISVGFSAVVAANADNVYTLQLSNATGNFSRPIRLAAMNGNMLSGTFNALIPNGTPSGTNYRMRVVSSRLASVSDPSAALTVNSILGDVPATASYAFIGNAAGKNYYRSTSSSGGGTAANTAESNGGILATVYDSVSNNLLHYNAFMANARMYIGLNDIAEEGTFLWRDGSGLSYENWAPNQPDNAGNEDYVEIRNDNGFWNDRSNTVSQPHFLQLTPAGFDQTFCLGSDLQLAALSIPGASYTWTGPDGFATGNQNPVITNATDVNVGTYTLNIGANGCTATETVDIAMNPLPSSTAIIALSPSVCEGTTANLAVINSDPDATYQLRNATAALPIGNAITGNGDTLFFTTETIEAASAFNFLVENAITSCNIITPNIEIAVLPKPAPPVAINDEVCNSGQMTVAVSGASGSDTYSWYNVEEGGQAIAGLTGNSLTIDTNATATYFVAIIDQNGCEGNRTELTGLVIHPLNPPVDLISGLILHYPFDGNLNDASGNGYNATSSGSVTFVNDRNSNPLSAVNSTSTTSIGGNNFINAGNPPKIQALANGSTMSVSFWFKQTQSWFDDGNNIALINKFNQVNLSGWAIGLYMPSPAEFSSRIRWRVNGSVNLTSTASLTLNQWHHVVCTYNGAQLRIYQNGVLAGSLNHTGSIQNVAQNLTLGRYASGHFGNSLTYRGDYDEVKIYDRALNGNEVLTLFNNESVAFVNTPFCDELGNLTLTTFNFPGATYAWTGPNGFSSNQQNPSSVMNADSATYAGTYSLVVTDGNGCSAPVQTTEALIYEIPPAPTTINDTICGSGNAELSAQSSLTGAAYRWYTLPAGGSPIANQNGASLTINNVTSTQTRYVSVVRNDCESPRVLVEAIFVNAANAGLSVSGASICQGEMASITVAGAESGVNYQLFKSGVAASNSVVGNGSDLTITVFSSALIPGSNTFTIQAVTPGCNAVTLTATGLISVLETNQTTQMVSACDSYTWIDGITYSQSTSIPEFALSNQFGCDSIVTLNLTINTSTAVTNLVSACESFTWIDGITYTANNNSATFLLTDMNGCDSLVNLNLTINQSSSGEDVVVACEEYTWIDGITYTSSNTDASFVLSNQFGCDSLVSLNLTIHSGSTSEETVTACDSYTWSNGVTYTQSTSTPMLVFSNQFGCDSTIVLNLSINSSSSTIDNIDACEPYTWIDGITYTSTTNDASVTLTSQAGCDSVIVLDLFIPEIDVSVENQSPLLMANQANAAYQWVDCAQDFAPIPGETGQSFMAPVNGSFAVVISLDGCSSTSLCQDVLNVNTREFPDGSVQVFPNPTAGMVFLEGNTLSKVQYMLYSADSRLIASGWFNNANGRLVIDISNEPSGLYYLLLNDETFHGNYRIVKL
jgi:hypothetical protein